MRVRHRRVVIASPAATVADVLDDAGQAGAKAAIVITAGFSEAGDAAAERQILEVARKWDLRVVGPNCAGIVNTRHALFPTLETRIMDVCTRLDDTVSLTALLVCILRMLYRLRTNNQRWRIYTPMLIRENRWRAMRYSFDEGLIDLAKGAVVPFEELLNEMLCLIAEDAEALGCTDEVNDLRHIMHRGTSAHRQLKKYELEVAGGASHEEALQAVVDKLVNDTAEGL